MRRLEWVGAQQAVDALHEVLCRDRVMLVRLEAAAALAQLDKLPEIFDLMGALRMGEAPVTRLHGAIFRVAAQQDHDALIECLRYDLPPSLRALIIDSLGWANDYAVLPALEGAALSPHVAVRRASLRAAEKLGHPSAARWVEVLLDDRAEGVRALALRCLVRLGAVPPDAKIAEMRTDPSPWVRYRAARTVDGLEQAA